MSVGPGFSQLGSILAGLEERGVEIESVSSTGNRLIRENELRVEVVVKLTAIEEVLADDNTWVHTPDGEPIHDCVSKELALTIRLDDAHQEPIRSDETAGGDPSVDVAADPSASEPAAIDTRLDDVVGADERDDEIDERDDAADCDVAADPARPYYEDRDRLQQVYDECDTFAEMTEALGVDVTPATVRQHMVKHGIHPTDDDSTDTATDDDSTDTATDDPTDDDSTDDDSTDTAAGAVADEETRIEIADGLGLPEGLTLDDVKDAVRESRTLYDTQTKLGLDAEVARTLLRDLGLIDLVYSRLSTDHSEFSDDEIDERIRSAIGSS